MNAQGADTMRLFHGMQIRKGGTEAKRKRTARDTESRSSSGRVGCVNDSTSPGLALGFIEYY